MPTDAGGVRFLGIEFTGSSYEQVARELVELAGRNRFSYFVTPNVDHVLLLNPRQRSATTGRLQAAYDEAAMRLCDSRILQLLARFSGIGLDVVTGSDLTAYLFRNRWFAGRKVALVGGDEAMIAELGARFADLEIVQHLPPMGVLRNEGAIDAIVDFVARERADFTLFAIGAPQSEIVAAKCKADRRCRGVGLCIGASIEFLVDRKRRAPIWMQRLHLEWAFRLLSEPRRLWRRYLVTGPRIFALAWRDRAH